MLFTSLLYIRSTICDRPTFSRKFITRRLAVVYYSDHRMSSSLALKRLLSSSTRYLNPLRQSVVSSTALRASDRSIDHRHRDFSSSPGYSINTPGRFDPFSWRSKNMVQSSQYSSVASGIVDVSDTGKEDTLKKNVLRPLSPHLPIYKPQLSSTTSILNRISAVYLSAYVLGFYLVPIKLGAVIFSYESFYQFLFYSSKLSLLSTEIAALAFAYHAYAGVRHLLMDVSGTV